MVTEHNLWESNLCAAGNLLAQLANVYSDRLLAYYSLERLKVLAIGHPDTIPDVPSPNVDKLEKCAEIFRSPSIKKVVNFLSNLREMAWKTWQ